ncbi:hypothetical protein I5M27_08765 [Adhaeribacter sp. BT258]|uniref:Uncharacterized protein n=1 Tax=Adhaeribacter terrigena TaxID=2793070 RepID=A0ABS1C0Y4_9BACT|nr:hypothetical protein [Adhaeribacter terrigena]MBK0403077.1 hypothetical protein [Adhaeribacter terrigena]
MEQNTVDTELSDSESFAALFERLTTPLLLLKDSGVASKNFNDWRRADLWFDDESEKRTWTKLSFEQHIWLKMLQQLRQFGCSTELILSVKQQLLVVPDFEAAFKQYEQRFYSELKKLSLSPDEEAKQIESFKSGELFKQLKETAVGQELGAGMSMLRSLLIAALVKHQHAAILVYPDSRVVPWLDEISLIDPEVQKLFKRTHFYLSITEHLMEFLTDPDKERFIAPLQLLSPEELQVLRALRDNTIKTITIQTEKDSKSKKVSKTMFTTKGGVIDSQDQEAIMDILLNKKYKSFEFDRRNGNRFYFESEYRKEL